MLIFKETTKHNIKLAEKKSTWLAVPFERYQVIFSDIKIKEIENQRDRKTKLILIDFQLVLA